ncbi:MAG: DUF6144 family protein [Oscillospiraceae bacterium]|nr:DUF6144 family protein [Oscillospiraceae bacterium]
MFDIRKIQEKTIYEVVQSESGEETAQKIVYGETGRAKEETDAEWVNGSMRRLEEEFDEAKAKEIRMKCHCTYGMDEKIALVKELVANSSNMEELANQKKAKEAGLSCKDGILYLQFDFCTCPMLAKVERVNTLSWCHCTAGYSAELFEKAFDCKVKINLQKSIKHGDDRCLIQIIPQGKIW